MGVIIAARRSGELWRWRLATHGPEVALTATVGEAARGMAMRAAKTLFGSTRLDPCLHGPEGGQAATDGRHLHAFWQPVDFDRDGRIDHLDVFMPAETTGRARIVLAACQELRIHGYGDIALQPVCWAVTPEAAPRGAARIWIASTPFVGVRFASKRAGAPPRPGLSATEQLATELQRFRTASGVPLPRAAVVPIDPVAAQDAGSFRLGRRAQRGDTLRPRGWFAILFEAPVCGPLAFGLGAHFGLGRFRPLDDDGSGQIPQEILEAAQRNPVGRQLDPDGGGFSAPV